MPLKCIAIDDEPLALELIREYASRLPDIELAQTFENALAAAEFIRKGGTDLAFIDINMPDITGLDLVRSLDDKPMIIFTTAHKKFAFEGFELDAIDYLLKPISLPRFSKAVKKAMEYYAFKNAPAKEEEALYVYSEYRLVKIELHQIEYIESLEDYVRIHFTEGRPVMTLMSLKKMLEKLPEEKFRRIHRSYIVSVSKVKSIQNKKVMLASATELPVSNSYTDFIDYWKKSF